jgi:hypothetical protein
MAGSPLCAVTKATVFGVGVDTVSIHEVLSLHSFFLVVGGSWISFPHFLGVTSLSSTGVERYGPYSITISGDIDIRYTGRGLFEAKGY